MLCGFVANFKAFQPYINFKNRSRFDKITESLKVGTFFETQCRTDGCYSLAHSEWLLTGPVCAVRSVERK